MTDPIDHVALIRDRLATQFKDSPNINAYLAAILEHANTLEVVLCDVADILDIDTATGAQLDNIGALVGQPREFIPDIDPDTFTFDIGPGFDVGEFIINTNAPVAIDDDDYRRWIKARIASNINNITGEDIIASIQFVFGEEVEVIFRDGLQEYVVDIGKALTLADRYLLTLTDILPRTAAVNGRFGVSFTPDSFRFDEGPGFDVGTFSDNI